MAMWKPYRRAVQAVLPQARIVVDKFHVVRVANEALEKVRTMTYSVGLHKPEKSYGVDLLTFWEN